MRLILPAGQSAVAQARASLLAGRECLEIFTYERSASRLESIDFTDRGNVRSELRRAIELDRTMPADALELLRLARDYAPEAVAEWTPEGTVSFRLHGLEFARQAIGAEALLGGFMFGIDHAQPLAEPTRPAFIELLRQIAAQRHARGNRRDPLFALHAERWMEELLRADIQRLSPELDSRGVYQQVPVCMRAHRDVLDLLAVTRAGRLAVIELKADEDVGFALQALDYWRAVRHHQQRGDFERLGYFPGVTLSPVPPLLMLVAPALRWHPRSDDILRWIGAHVPIMRVEINEEWRKGIEVLDRRERPAAP